MVITDPWCSLIKSANSVKMEFSARATLSEPSGLHLTRSSLIEVDSERVQYWLGVGAQPTDAVEKLFKVTGDWQKFKGLPGAEGTLKTAEPKPNKAEVFAAAAKEAANLDGGAAPTPKAKKKAEPKADEAEAASEA